MAPIPRPALWASTQRLFPYFDYAPNVYPEAIAHVQSMKQGRSFKSASFGEWDFAGPVNIGGRISDIEFDPQQPDIAYAGAATGGVFKSLDKGQTWFPIFDDQAVLSIGDIAVDPVNSSTLYVGTGEANGGHNNFAGGGVYKSTDGGDTWVHLGLSETTSIGRILIDPQNPNRVWLAAVGSYFKENPERGVYKSEDGGLTWEHMLFVSEAVGAIDLVLDPQNPDRLFAAMWERVRGYSTARLAGPGSGIYRTTDGGNSWTELGANNGLPSEHSNAGRIGLTISPLYPQTLYALYTDGVRYLGFYKTHDGGDTWMNADPSGGARGGTGTFSWYFGQTRVHPTDTARVFLMDIPLKRSDDGGNVWQSFSAGHADYHAASFSSSGSRLPPRRPRWRNRYFPLMAATPGDQYWTYP